MMAAVLPQHTDDRPVPAVPDPVRARRPDRRFWLHSALSLAAVITLLVNTRTLWTAYALTRPVFTVALTLCYGFALVAAILALCLRTSAALARLDVVVLGGAMLIKVLALWPAILGENRIVVDEGMIMNHAAWAVAVGRNPYLMSWPEIEPSATPLMNGGMVLNFGYPPFGAELGGAVQWASTSVVGIVVIATLALLATAAIVFFTAPVPLRPLATAGVLGIGLLTSYAANAYPSMIALPFLCLAAWRWTAIGRGGRLGPGGVVRAAALGLAVSTHQLGWFLAVFLVTGLALIRRGELSWRATAVVLLRYVGVAAGVAVAVNAPYLIGAPAAWWTGVMQPLIQHAVPHGQGVMAVSYYLIGGSGALDFYGYASIALLAATLAAFAVHLQWLGRAAVVLPWLLFWVATRSQDGYWVLTMPLWIVGLCTTAQADFAHAFRFRLPRLRLVATAAWFLPAAACVTVAMTTPPPLSMRLISSIAPDVVVRQLAVEVSNRSSRPVTPHFDVTTGVDIGPYWSVNWGPATLAPHETAVYLLAPPLNGVLERTWRPVPTDTAYLRAVSDRPQTLSSVPILRPSDTGVTP